MIKQYICKHLVTGLINSGIIGVVHFELIVLL
jgi:uncharacterized membrane protein YuzA (DUF378 family)